MDPQCPSLQRLDGRHLAALRRNASSSTSLRGILSRIERLPPGDGLCHCDLHPGNVIMTADGPRIIDWDGAVRAPAALDLACCHISLSELAPEVVDNPERARARSMLGACSPRVCAARRHVRRGPDSGDGATPAHRSRPPPPRDGSLPSRPRLIQRVEDATRSKTSDPPLQILLPLAMACKARDQSIPTRAPSEARGMGSQVGEP